LRNRRHRRKLGSDGVGGGRVVASDRAAYDERCGWGWRVDGIVEVDEHLPNPHVTGVGPLSGSVQGDGVGVDVVVGRVVVHGGKGGVREGWQVGDALEAPVAVASAASVAQGVAARVYAVIGG
jgi:hypothetical protein